MYSATRRVRDSFACSQALAFCLLSFFSFGSIFSFGQVGTCASNDDEYQGHRAGDDQRGIMDQSLAYGECPFDKGAGVIVAGRHVKRTI